MVRIPGGTNTGCLLGKYDSIAPGLSGVDWGVVGIACLKYRLQTRSRGA